MNQETGGGRREAGLEPEADLAAARKRLESIEGREYWRSRRGAARDRGLPRAPPPGVPRADRLRRQPPGAADAHGRVDRAGGSDGLHAAADRADLPVRQGARGDRPGRGRSTTRRRTSTAATRAASSPRATRDGPSRSRATTLHPASLGGTDVFAQGFILNMYDPDRSQTTDRARADPSLERLLRRGALALEKERPTRGAGLRILTGTVTSPTLAAADRRRAARSFRRRSGSPGSRPGARTSTPARGSPSARTSSRSHPSIRPTSSCRSRATSWEAARPCRGTCATSRRAAARAPTAMNRLYVVESTPT